MCRAFIHRALVRVGGPRSACQVAPSSRLLAHARAGSLLLVLALGLSPTSHAQLPCGDCDGNGAVGVLDALLAAQHAVGLITLTGEPARRCDVNQDLAVDVLDSVRLTQHAVGLPAPLSCAPPPAPAPTWMLTNPADTPGPRTQHAVVFYPATGSVYLLGGYDGTGLRNDMMRYDGSEWSDVSVPAALLPRLGHAMVTDKVRQAIVLFGGLAPAGLLNDTWIWNGTTWFQPTASSPPSERVEHAMVYDYTREVILLFGGVGRSSLLDDTWEFDGTIWVRRNPSHSPSARASHAMAHDFVDGQTVLFGGSDKPDRTLKDTWVWDGSDWTELLPLQSPPGRRDHAMVFDPASGVIRMFGGESLDGGLRLLNDTWEFRGSTWVEVGGTVAPSARRGHAMAQDATRGVTVLVGGESTSPQEDTWEWR